MVRCLANVACVLIIFALGLDEDAKTDKEDREDDKTETESDEEEETGVGEVIRNDSPPVETPYVENVAEELGQVFRSASFVLPSVLFGKHRKRTK